MESKGTDLKFIQVRLEFLSIAFLPHNTLRFIAVEQLQCRILSL